MSKYYGKIGFATSTEVKPGIWEDAIYVRAYYGDVFRNIRLLQSSNNINDNINVANQISIVSDPFATQNFHAMRYIEYMGSKWKISNVEIQYPRLILTIGGLYNA